MSIRTHLLLSYFSLIIMIFLGIWVMGNRILTSTSAANEHFVEEGVLSLTRTNYLLAEEVLTQIGEAVVRDKAEDVARELSYLLRGRKSYDYARMRLDRKLRQIAIQTIHSLGRAAGYTDVYDNKGFILFHPDPAVEGKNQLDWKESYPETTALIQRSLTKDYISGYFTFFDVHKKERRRYSVRVHVPGTPFIVGAIVNIDEFFQPTQHRMRKASQESLDRARVAIQRHKDSVIRQVQGWGLAGGGLFFGLSCIFGFGFAASLSRPLRRLRDGVRQIGEGDFSVAVPARGVREVVHLARSFNELGRQLTDYMEKRDFIRDTFGRYVTQEVVKKLLEDRDALELGGDKREV
ncbi:MAG: HAMP domain-containing protein, partial [Deltaproteobacteria bacterium]|nr:HAMP domain-containing protein [Deltaproteobacteria bacterium]